MICVGGLPFDVCASIAFVQRETQLLALIRRLAVQPITDATFTLRLVDKPAWTPLPEEIAPLGEPATLHFVNDVIRIAHAEVIGELDVVARRGSYARRVDSAAPLRIMLRTAFAAALPICGGLPLHAAGVVSGDEAILFFGESGAGKSTIAAVAGLSVISDEIVAVTVEDGGVFARATGFGDEIHSSSSHVNPVRVAALVQLVKGECFDVVSLTAHQAIEELLKVILSPPQTVVWTAALGVLRRIVRSGVPLVRMTWSPATSPVPALAEWLRRLPHEADALSGA